MEVLAVLSGTGHLVVKGTRLEVDYTLNVKRRRGIMSGDGRLTGNTFELMRTFDAPQAVLELDDGREVTVVIANLRGNEASFQTSGPIPGF